MLGCWNGGIQTTLLFSLCLNIPFPPTKRMCTSQYCIQSTHLLLLVVEGEGVVFSG